MKVTELNQAQLEELKQNYIMGMLESVSYEELIHANEIPNQEIFSAYEGIDFCEDDFFCSAWTKDK